MTVTCHPLPSSVAGELLQQAARAFCDRPGEAPSQRDSRTHQMVHLTLATDPRDGLEYMLSILAVGHFNLIMESMREFFVAQPEARDPRAKSAIVALDRALLSLVKELRLSRKRPAADPAEQTSKPPVKNTSSTPAPAPAPPETPSAPEPSASQAAPSEPPEHASPESDLAVFKETLVAIAETLETLRAIEKENTSAIPD